MPLTIDPFEPYEEYRCPMTRQEMIDQITVYYTKQSLSYINEYEPHPPMYLLEEILYNMTDDELKNTIEKINEKN